MGTLKLSDTLKQAGFFNASGTTEMPGFSPCPVKLGTPSTWGQNNGVVAVYDEAGNPWIIRAQEVTPEVRRAVFSYELGGNGCAHVPHSNDGGNFVRKDMPALLVAQTPERPALIQPIAPDFFIEVEHGTLVNQMVKATGRSGWYYYKPIRPVSVNPDDYEMLDGGSYKVGVKLVSYNSDMHFNDVLKDFQKRGFDRPYLAEFCEIGKSAYNDKIGSNRSVGLVKGPQVYAASKHIAFEDDVDTENKKFRNSRTWSEFFRLMPKYTWKRVVTKREKKIGSCSGIELHSKGTVFVAIVSRQPITKS